MSLEVLIEFLKAVDHEFSPKLSEQVEISDYAARLINQAILVNKKDENGRIKGLVVIYVNEPNNPHAYIPLVAVRQEFRKMGLAKSLVQEAIQFAKESGKTAVDIHTNNPIAYKMYRNLGFEDVIGGENRAGHPRLSFKIEQ